MGISRQYNSKRLSSKWLLLVVLLLSFFTFSGFNTPSQANTVSPQTTLVVSNRSKVAKTISYGRLLIVSCLKNEVSPTFVDLNGLYNHQIKIRLTISSGSYIGLQTRLFYKVKIPSSATDDDPAIILG